MIITKTNNKALFFKAKNENINFLKKKKAHDFFLKKNKHSLILSQKKNWNKQRDQKQYIKSRSVFFRLRSRIRNVFGFKKSKVYFRLDETKIRNQKPKRNYFYRRFKIAKIVSFLYGGLTRRGRWKISRNLRKKLGGLKTEKTIFSLENRLDILLVRSNLAGSIGIARNFIFNGLILINKKPITNISYVLKPYEILEINKNFKSLIRKEYLQKLHNSRSEYVGLKRVPKYLEMNYKTLALIYIPKIFKKSMLNFNLGTPKHNIFGLGKHTF